ncbi:MAG: hypothetical protein KC964_29600 [Candidatus Omnitrophica bacterium]|nr:hypothetical protein [Candidatus Omnitrophota bacterium]
MNEPDHPHAIAAKTQPDTADPLPPDPGTRPADTGSTHTRPSPPNPRAGAASADTGLKHFRPLIYGIVREMIWAGQENGFLSFPLPCHSREGGNP